MENTTVSVNWLLGEIGSADLRIVDASWHLPAAGRDAETEFTTAHIPGAVFFDIDKCVTRSDLPHMAPSEQCFADYAGSMGISNDDRIVVYDTVGLFSAARVWWMFRHFGARNVAILDGGLPAWLAIGGEVESGNASAREAWFFASQDNSDVAVIADILAAMEDNETLILDARSFARFTAEEKEARHGLLSGHIPGSKSLPFTELLAPNGALKSAEELRGILAARGYDGSRPLITSCGSGVTASVICAAFDKIGATGIRLYDGSWAEWGREDLRLPIETGA